MSIKPPLTSKFPRKVYFPVELKVLSASEVPPISLAVWPGLGAPGEGEAKLEYSQLINLRRKLK